MRKIRNAVVGLVLAFGIFAIGYFSATPMVPEARYAPVRMERNDWARNSEIGRVFELIAYGENKHYPVEERESTFVTINEIAQPSFVQEFVRMVEKFLQVVVYISIPIAMLLAMAFFGSRIRRKKLSVIDKEG